MATGDLTTVADVKAFLGITFTTDDALIQTLVSNASAFIGQYCNRRIMSASYTESYNGYGGDTLVPNNFPITQVASVMVDGVVIPAAGSPTQSGFVNDDKAIYLRGYSFNTGRKNVQVTYTAGFATVPPELAQACIEIIAVKYKRRTEYHVSGRTLDGQMITYNTADVPASAGAVLSQYQRVHYSP